MIRNIAWVLLATAVTTVGCSRGLRPESGVDTDTDRDTNGDTDTSDVDTSDVDTDTETGFPDCNAPYPTPDPGGVSGYPSCYTGILTCDSVVYATTEGGSDEIDSYTKWRCARDIDLSGPERVYSFVQPAGVSAVIRLHDRCGNFRLIEFLLGNSAEDDIENERLCGRFPETTICDVGTGRPDYQELSYPTYTHDRYVELIVDSEPQSGGNYVLEVICGT